MRTSRTARRAFSATIWLPRHCLGIENYRRYLAPPLGELRFYNVSYSRLVAIADDHDWGKKNYNNTLSALRRAFDFGYRDRPLEANPARSLRGVHVRKADRPKVDPFCVHDAETLIAAIHRDWGEAQGNYDEFRFFTELRPSEQIACPLGSGCRERHHQHPIRNRHQGRGYSLARGELADDAGGIRALQLRSELCSPTHEPALPHPHGGGINHWRIDLTHRGGTMRARPTGLIHRSHSPQYSSRTAVARARVSHREQWSFSVDHAGPEPRPPRAIRVPVS